MEEQYATVALVQFLFGIFCAYWAQTTERTAGCGSSWDGSLPPSRGSFSSPRTVRTNPRRTLRQNHSLSHASKKVHRLEANAIQGARDILIA